MKHNIVIYNDMDQEATLRLKISTSNYIFLPYRLSEDKNSCQITNVEFFLEAIKTESGSDIRFPILAFEPQSNKITNHIYIPSHVNVNLDVEDKSLQIINICVNHERDNCRKRHDFLFTANQIKSVSLYKRDERCAYLYVHQSDDFQMCFPSAICRQRFYDYVLEMTKEGEGFVR